jgi:hypothetical protein
MSDSIQKFLDFHKEAGGTGKLFNFELVEYREGYLELRCRIYRRDFKSRWFCARRHDDIYVR